MSQFLDLINLVAPFFGLIGLGILAAKFASVPASGLAWMQVFLLYLALPCLFFRLLANTPIAEIANWRFIAATTLATAGAFAVGFVVMRAGSRRLPDATIGAVSASYSNIGYMGPPLVAAFLGPVASAPVALIFVFDTLFLFTVVPTLMALAGVERRSPLQATFGVLRRVLLHPFLLATAAGLLASVFKVRPPVAAATIIDWLAGASAPCALFTLGVSVALQPVGRVGASVGMLVTTKLLLHPALVWLLLSGLGGADAVWVQAAIIMAALPPALNIFVLASQYRAGVEGAAACVLVGTIVSMATLTGLLWLLRTGAIPPLLFGN